MIVIEDVHTHDKKVVYSDANGYFQSEWVDGEYMIKPWLNQEFVGFQYVDKPQHIKFLIVECDADLYRIFK